MKHLFYRIRHLSRRRRNRAIAAFVCINAILAFLIYSNLFVYPNTYMGDTNISGYTAGRLKQFLSGQHKVHPKIQVKDRTYTYEYDRLGVVMDPDMAVDRVFAPNRKMFPLNALAFLTSLGTVRSLEPPLTFTQSFDRFVSDMIFDFNVLPDQVSVDPTLKSLVVEENSQAYRFDRESLQSLLISHYGNYDHPIYPMLAKIGNETISQIADANQKLSAVFGSPLMVYLNLGGVTTAVELKEEDLREAITVTLDAEPMNVGLRVNPEALDRVLTRRIHTNGFPIRNNLVTQNVIADFTQAITLRVSGADVGAVSTVAGAGPTTNGTLAEKYIEIDIAQAKMYLFRNGSVIKSFPVSTGVDYPTPVGKFTIINKVGLGYSSIYKNWLPWWMGFSYSDELNAYFGIHEQPYVLTQDGKPVAADPRPIGTPSTGGCVALAPGAAREVYAFADIGTPVYIFN